MKKEYIEHIDDRGVIESIDRRNNRLKVRLTNGKDCPACPAARVCSMASSSSKLLTVDVTSAQRFSPGMEVLVRGSERLHRKAIMLATVLPCIALIAVMVLVYTLTGNQGAAAVSGIGMMVIFYLTLWLLRNRIAHEFQFEVLPIDN